MAIEVALAGGHQHNIHQCNSGGMNPDCQQYGPMLSCDVNPTNFTIFCCSHSGLAAMSADETNAQARALQLVGDHFGTGPKLFEETGPSGDRSVGPQLFGETGASDHQRAECPPDDPLFYVHLHLGEECQPGSHHATCWSSGAHLGCERVDIDSSSWFLCVHAKDGPVSDIERHGVAHIMAQIQRGAGVKLPRP